jgi:hypothetical protein
MSGDFSVDLLGNVMTQKEQQVFPAALFCKIPNQCQ